MPDYKELEELGLHSLKTFWGLENGTIESMTSKQVNVLIQKAKLGMQFYREFNVESRSKEHNTIRVCSMIAKDKDELRKLLRSGLPNYVTSK